MKYTQKIDTRSTPKKCIKAVSGTSAPFGTRCEDEKTKKKEIEEIERILQTMKAKNIEEYYLAMFLLETGCRISEALQIKQSDIDNLGRVKIKGLKGSSNRIVTSPATKEYLINQKKIGGQIFSRFNRFYIYRVFKRYGLGRFFGDNKRQSVTHYFRHINAMIAKEIATDIKEISDILGHKNAKNTEIYIRE